MTEQKLAKDLPFVSNEPRADEMEIELMDILRKIIAIRKTLYKAVGIGLVIGIIVALSIPKKYTVEVTLSPEMGNSKGNSGLASMAASFLGSGAGMSGDGMDALNASLSPEIVSSTPFLLELLSMSVPSGGEESEKIDLGSYLDSQSSPWWSYVMGLPGMAISGVRALFADKDEYDGLRNNKSGTIELTKEEDKKITSLKKNITAMMDKKTAITNVSVTLQDPKVAAVVADSVVHKLQEYITSYRTFKAKEDCAYLEKLFKERQEEYYVAQKKYAEYVDTHDNLILLSVRAEQERLQNDMSLAYQVYSQVANQLQLAQAKVQEEKPVFAVVEPAVVPQQPSGTGRKTYVIVFVFLSLATVIGWKLFGEEFWDKLKREFV
ncbi:chain-length determining protein [Bacteroides thetaiotaomicron]|uniref:chain-length determining protein n=1 Tax=Bacteroides thetaiotaomicron TaxID=818 RepID=UPI0028F42E2D|nr:chain-length determining protein [Bacteroides thetaiotaomicron]WOG20833.1 chain-length determining protein [Bacteroides thetaiotaomicron]